ncbi:MAG: ribosome small subunit-dependent GTPase A [Oscillospiraceae bacterium]|nr:ribosome small subunit-dependent GTPase A [Oscillospiraceae bacterium]
MQPEKNSLERGIILKSLGGLYFVENTAAPGCVLECRARGIFRKENISPCAGDFCKVENGVITEIYPRRNYIVRPPLANLDCMVFVISTCQPAPCFLVADKFIAVCENKGIEPIVAVTKSDLQSDEGIAETYGKIGISAITVDYGKDPAAQAVMDKIKGKVSAFTGNTGVGKSTLLNHLFPRLEVETAEISQKLGRGRHTTRTSELYAIEGGGYIADTPGFSSFDTNRYDIIYKEDLKYCFREFGEFEGKCRFADCSHTAEKGCAVIDAVNRGVIPKSRHDSYLAMYEDAKKLKEWELQKR